MHFLSIVSEIKIIYLQTRDEIRHLNSFFVICILYVNGPYCFPHLLSIHASFFIKKAKKVLPKGKPYDNINERLGNESRGSTQEAEEVPLLRV